MADAEEDKPRGPVLWELPPRQPPHLPGHTQRISMEQCELREKVRLIPEDPAYVALSTFIKSTREAEIKKIRDQQGTGRRRLGGNQKNQGSAGDGA